MSCPHLEETSALFDDALDVDDAARARTHLASCGECGALHRDLLRLRADLQDARRATDRVPMPTDARRPRSLPLRISLAFNVLLLLALLGLGVAQQRRLADAARDGGVFAGLDAGARPVVHVRPRTETP